MKAMGRRLVFLRLWTYYLSKPLTSLSCSLNAVFPGLKMWDTFAFDSFDFKVRPGTPATNLGLHQGIYKQTTVQPKVSTDYLLLQCLQRSPGRRVTENSHFSALKVGLAFSGSPIMENHYMSGNIGQSQNPRALDK
jgi:hypothetical protein